MSLKGSFDAPLSPETPSPMDGGPSVTSQGSSLDQTSRTRKQGTGTIRVEARSAEARGRDSRSGEEQDSSLSFRNEKSSDGLTHSSTQHSIINVPLEHSFPAVPQPILHSVYMDFPVIHPITLRLFLRGETPNDIYNTLKIMQMNEMGSTDPKLIAQFTNLLYYDVQSQYRMIKSLIPLLEEPKVFLNEDQRWSRAVKERYIKLYFTIDKRVLRELLGKKLGGRERRELDETVAKTGTPIFACRRMFDNLRDVLETIREIPRDGSLSLNELIQEQFQFDGDVCRQYSIGVFSCHHQFTLGSRTVWLKDLEYEDLEFCIATIMLHWTRHGMSGDPLQIDLDFSLLREIKHYIFTYPTKIEHLIKNALSTLKMSSKVAKQLQSALKPIVKNLFWISGKLHQKKELRDFLIDISEKFGEPCVEQCQLSADDIYKLCERLIAGFPSILDKRIKEHERVTHTWTYFMIVVRDCIHRILEKSSWSKQRV